MTFVQHINQPWNWTCWAHNIMQTQKRPSSVSIHNWCVLCPRELLVLSWKVSSQTGFAKATNTVFVFLVLRFTTSGRNLAHRPAHVQDKWSSVSSRWQPGLSQISGQQRNSRGWIVGVLLVVVMVSSCMIFHTVQILYRGILDFKQHYSSIVNFWQ